MSKKPKDWGYQPHNVKHDGDRHLEAHEFSRKVSNLRTYGPHIWEEGGIDLHSMWNQTLVPLARDLLPTKELASLVQSYTHNSVKGFDHMDRETRLQLMQSVITRIGKRLKQGGGGGGGQGQGQGGQGQGQGQGGGGQGKPQKQKKPEKPKQWSQMTPQERQQLRESIENGQVSDQKPSQGGQAIDPRSLPRDLAQKLQQQAQQRAEENKRATDAANRAEKGESQKAGQGGQAAPQAGGSRSDGPLAETRPESQPASRDGQVGRGEEASGQRPDTNQSRQEVGAKADKIHDKLQQARQAERVNTGQQQDGPGGEKAQVSHIGPGQRETNFEKLDDEDWQALIDETTSTNPDHSQADGFLSVEEMLRNVGFGGGGPTMDLKLPMKTTEERLFHIVQEAFMRLGGEPDPSDRVPDGIDIWSPKRIAISHWKPHMLPMAKDDFARSPEDIYFILDTSGSVSSYANVIAAMAAGALGLVHLFHGAEAHPQYQIVRNVPLKHPRQFKGLGREYGNANDKDKGQKEKQLNISNPGNPKYDRWLETVRDKSRGHTTTWEGNVEFFLRQVRPARGSRLIFWGDTMSVDFKDPLRIQRMLAPYRFVWMLPFGTDEFKRHYGSWGQGVPTHDEVLANPGQYSSCEYIKLQAVGLQVIGGANSPEGLRNALRQVR